MTREEKIKMAIEKGITCDINTGKVYGIRGREIKTKRNGYITIGIQLENKKTYLIQAHQFIFYYKYNKIIDCIDHINGVRDDNRIENLREVTRQQNAFNTKAKGYCWCKNKNKWKSEITHNYKKKHLGYFDKEEDASDAYLAAKKIYHVI